MFVFPSLFHPEGIDNGDEMAGILGQNLLLLSICVWIHRHIFTPGACQGILPATFI